MATFEEHIEGLTRIAIESSGTAPTETQLQGFLRDGVKDCINKIINLSPEEISKFTKTTNATDSVTKSGKIISVVREHDSTSILRPCTPINPSLRYEASDVNSLHYRSKYNPAYYELDGLIRTVPEAASGNNDIIVTQVHYDTGIEPSNNYNAGAIDNFPIEYEYLIGLYGASLSCRTAAIDLENSFPTEPSAPPEPIKPDIPDAPLPPNVPIMPSVPSFPDVPESPLAPVNEASEIVIPDLPIYIPPTISVSFHEASASIGGEDFDKVDRYFTKVDKELSIYDARVKEEETLYNRELDLYNSELEKLTKDADRELQASLAEYKNELELYQGKLQAYQGEYQATLEKLKTEISIFQTQYQSDVELYKTNIAKYQAEYQVELEVYKAELTRYQSLYKSDMEDYQVSLAGHTTKYQWFVQRADELWAQYTEGIFRVAKPKQPQQESKKKG